MKKAVNLQTSIVVTLRVEGIHRWIDAPEFKPEVAYLEHPHRHIFYIKVKKVVTHADRDIEIIVFKRDILRYLQKYFDYGSKYQLHDFKKMSCEMIAEDILTTFEATEVEVLEDGENGAVVTATFKSR